MPGKSSVSADALLRCRADQTSRLDTRKSVSLAKAQAKSSTLVDMKVYYVTSSMASDIRECYGQGDHCRLLLDYFGPPKILHGCIKIRFELSWSRR